MDVIRENELEDLEGKSRDAGLESKDKPCRVCLLRVMLGGKDPEILTASQSFNTSVYFHETRRFPALFTPARKVNAVYKHVLFLHSFEQLHLKKPQEFSFPSFSSFTYFYMQFPSLLCMLHASILYPLRFNMTKFWQNQFSPGNGVTAAPLLHH